MRGSSDGCLFLTQRTTKSFIASQVTVITSNASMGKKPVGEQSDSWSQFCENESFELNIIPAESKRSSECIIRLFPTDTGTFTFSYSNVLSTRVHTCLYHFCLIKRELERRCYSPKAI